MSTTRTADSAFGGGRRRFRGLSPDERVGQRREQLLEAGLEAFGTRGFHASGVREICALAKLTERYFYESFKNREALFVAVHERAVQRLRAAISEALQSPTSDAIEVSRRALRVVLETYRDDPRVARITLIEVLSAGVSATSLAVSQGFADLIAQLTLSLNPSLAQRGFDVRGVANGLYGSTVYIAMRWTASGFAQPLSQVLEDCLLFYAAIVNTLQEPAVGPKPRRPARQSASSTPQRESASAKSGVARPARTPRTPVAPRAPRPSRPSPRTKAKQGTTR